MEHSVVLHGQNEQGQAQEQDQKSNYQEPSKVKMTQL